MISDNVKKQLQNEIKFGLRSKTKLIKYANEFKIFFKNFQKKITRKNIKKNIFCIGAARSLPIIIKILDIEHNVESVLDNNKFKYNKYLPSRYSIKIENQNNHKYSKEKIYLVTAWVHTERVLRTLKKHVSKTGENLKIITIFPKFKILHLK